MARAVIRATLAWLLVGALAACGGGADDAGAEGDTMRADAGPRDGGAPDTAAAGDGRSAADGSGAAVGDGTGDAGDTPLPGDGRDVAAVDARRPDGEADAADGGGAIECPPPPDDLPAPPVRVEGRHHVVDAFPVEGLAARAVRIYLPADYDAAPQRRHPVLYLHDGQNLFDPAIAPFGEWRVDETVDALVAAGDIPPVIVVGVDNTDARLDEYRSGPDPTADDASAASAYRTFLAERLKPWVDAHYRTRCERGAAALVGSSMGGVASLAHALRYPAVWGRIGALSTAFWFGGHELPDWLADHDPRTLPERVWLDVGTAESTTGGGDTGFVLDTRGVRDRLRALGMRVGDDLGYLEDIGAIHNEAEWARRLPDVLRFLLGDPPAAVPTGIRLAPFAAQILAGGPGTELAVQTEIGAIAQTLPNDLVAFASDDTAIATVAVDGHVTPAGEGTTTIHATYGDLAAGAPITVGAAAAVTFRVTVPASTPADATIFVAGDRAALGAWDGHGVAMTPVGGAVWEAVVALPPGVAIAYKYTRGSWATVEKGAGGEELDDRRATAAPGLVLEDTVARWADR